MKNWRTAGDIAFKGALALGVSLVVGCGGHSSVGSLGASGGRPALAQGSPADASVPCEGMCLPRLVGKLKLDDDTVLDYMSIDPDRKRVYGSGFRVDASNPLAMKEMALPKPGRVAVNPRTGRYAATDSEGRSLFIFNSNDTLYDSQPLSGVLLDIVPNPATDLYYLTTRDENQFVVYDERSRAQPTIRPLDQVLRDPVFDPNSNQVYLDWYLLADDVSGYAYRSLILDKDYDAGASVSGYVLAVDPAQHLVYVEGSPDSRLQVRVSGTWELAGTQFDTDAYWVAPDPILNRLYVQQLHDIAIFDQSSGAYLASLPLGDALPFDVAFVPGDTRIYVETYTSLTRETELLVFATQ